MLQGVWVSNNHDVEGPETEGAWTSATSLTFEPTALAVWFVKHSQPFELHNECKR